MIFHLIFNSLLVFIILSFLIKFLLYVLKIQNPRIRFFCLTLPILKLPFDFFVFASFGDHLFMNFNPFSCEMYTQELIMKVIPTPFKMEIQGMEHLIVPRYVATLIPPILLQIFLVGIVSITVAVTAFKLIQFIKCVAFFKRILRSSSPCTRIILNEDLRRKINKLKIIILTSDKVQSPFAANLKYILFPEYLMNELSQEEFEAVLAHEIEHLKWKDPLVKLFCVSICSFFWWIPTHWWLRGLETDQELACDAAPLQYGVDNYHLATALMKVIKSPKSELKALCYLDTAKNVLSKRMENLLKTPKKPHVRLNGIIAMILCLLIFNSFWMC